MTGASRQRHRPRFAVSPDRCSTCGRGPEGLRCDQPVTPGYERALAKAASLQQWEPGTRPAVAPCAQACPLSLCIQGYAKHIAAGELGEALGHIMVRTPLPDIVCRVCDRPCEPRCVRVAIDEPIAINDLKRFVIDWAVAQPQFPWSAPSQPSSGRRVAVIGAGPAGLSAARELAIRGHDVTLYDAADRPGGVPALCIPPYRLPEEAVRRDVARVLEQGVRFVGETALGRDVTLQQLLRDFDAVCLAIGAHRPRPLDLEGAGVPGAPATVHALDFLRGVVTGATTQVPARVVVIGGGDAAIDASRSALRLGARSVALACLEGRNEMPALPDETEAAEREGVALRPGLAPARLSAGAATFVPVGASDGPEHRLEADLVITAVGQQPDLSCLDAGAPKLARTEEGHLVVDPETGRTSHGRVYASGDLTPAGGTVTRAIGSGLRVAWAIDRELLGDASSGRHPPARLTTQSGAPPVPKTAAKPRRYPTELPVARRAAGFEEVMGSFSDADARAEAERCLACGLCGNCRACVDLFGCPALTVGDGHVVIEPLLCSDCGVCADLCPDDAILPGEREP